MLSLILYGRNDSYGYNLHKRAAISLNCMAEVLAAADDEIIFVDYNTPDDLPTFPEAIQDTLTARAKKLLRILRVRPSQHERFRHRTHLLALEPIARNVALRRSNPANRWILSTNTDMVFVAQRGGSFSEIVAGLPDAHYQLPRFEVPETLWESANRLDPTGTIEAFAAWGRSFHLNEIVLSAEVAVKYDAPGDFQLALRDDLWKMDGFHESMLLGWHVDSNLAKRLSLLPRVAGELLDDVIGYHCDHTRQVTPAHRPRAAENSLQEFYADVTSAQLPEQAKTWGLSGENVEEIQIDTTSRLYVGALQAAIPVPLAGVTPRITYSHEHYNRIDYAPEHVLPFLTDAVAGYPRDTILGWFGGKRTLLESFALAWRAMGFSKEIMVWSGARWIGTELPTGCVSSPIESVIALCDIFILDWGRRDDVRMEDWVFDSDESTRGVARALRHVVREERGRLAASSAGPRRFIGVNAVCNDAEWLFHELVSAARTPLATRIRQGYVNDLQHERELLGALNAGDAGRKISGDIASRPGVAGYLFYVPHLLLDSGMYRFSLAFEPTNTDDATTGYSGLGFEVNSNSCLLQDQLITSAELLAGSCSIDFVVPRGFDTADDWPETEIRMRTIGQADVRIRRAVLERLDSADEELLPIEFNFLPLLSAGAAGAFGVAPALALHGEAPRAFAINAIAGASDFLAYGPHVWLLPGRYEANYEFWTPAIAEKPGIQAAVEIVSAFGNTLFAERFVDFSERDVASTGSWLCVRGVLAFDIRTKAPATAEGLLEFRVWSEGAELSLTALDVRRVGDPGADQKHVERLFRGKLQSVREAIARGVRLAYDENLKGPDVLWLAKVGPSGKKVGSAIKAEPGVAAGIAHGPYLWLLPGHYEVTFKLSLDSTELKSGAVLLEVVQDQGDQILAARIVDITSSTKNQPYDLSFVITADMPPAETGLLEFRVWSFGEAAFALTSLRVRQVDPPPARAGEAPAYRLFGGRVDPIRDAAGQLVERAYIDHSRAPNMLGLMVIGGAGRRTPDAIESVPGEVTVLAHGPYIWLLPGRFEVTFEFEAERADPRAEILVDVATHLGTQILAVRGFTPHWDGHRFEQYLGRRKGKLSYTLPFEITTEAPTAEEGLLEFRVWAPGTIAFKLTAVLVRRVDAPNFGAGATVERSP